MHKTLWCSAVHYVLPGPQALCKRQSSPCYRELNDADLLWFFVGVFFPHFGLRSTVIQTKPRSAATTCGYSPARRNEPLNHLALNPQQHCPCCFFWICYVDPSPSSQTTKANLQGLDASALLTLRLRSLRRFHFFVMPKRFFGRFQSLDCVFPVFWWKC